MSSIPFLRFTPAFILGIIVSFYFQINLFYPVTLTVFSLLILALSPVKHYGYRWIFGLAFQFFIACCGLMSGYLSDHKNYADYFINFQGADEYIIKCVSDGELKKKYVRYQGEIFRVVANSKSYPSSGRVFLYLKPESEKLLIGQHIKIKNKPVRIAPPKNFSDFDFQYYAKVRHIEYQFFQKGKIILYKSSGFSLLRTAIYCRDYILQRLDVCGFKGQEKAVLAALLIGYDDEISKDTMKNYSASGTIHVLCVSGMHVGLIYCALLFLLKFLEKTSKKRLLRSGIIMVLIWMYAVLTGLSPSVYRAATMLTLILIAGAIQKQNNIYNSLLSSIVMILLFFDPYFIFYPGFQLSYLAVFGIVIFYKKFDSILYFKNKLLTNIWSIISVSTAAQLLTFPLALYYFHQFPNYFIPANLVILPLSTFVIFAGIITVFLSGINFVTYYLSFITSKSLWLLNYLSEFFRNFPYAVAENIQLNKLQVVLIYCLIGNMYDFSINKNFRSFALLQMTIIFLLASIIVQII